MKSMDSYPSRRELQRWKNKETPPSHHNLLRLINGYEKMVSAMMTGPAAKPAINGSLIEPPPPPPSIGERIGQVGNKILDWVDATGEGLD